MNNILDWLSHKNTRDHITFGSLSWSEQHYTLTKNVPLYSVLLAWSAAIVVKYNNVENQKPLERWICTETKCILFYFQLCKRVCHIFIRTCQSSAHVQSWKSNLSLEGKWMGEFISAEADDCQGQSAKRGYCLSFSRPVISWLDSSVTSV